MLTFYVAIIARHAGEYWATVPDLPGPNSAAGTRHDALVLVTQFANDHVRDLVERGASVPPARDLDDIEAGPEDGSEAGRALIPVDVR